jgi:adenylate kinase
MDKIYKIVILGPQGSGKGTQAEFLAEKLGIPDISIGQLLRDEVKKQSEISGQIDEYLKRGELVPNAITHKLAEERIKAPDCAKGFIFDGFPRILIQAKFLDTITEITNVLEIWISDEEALRRLSGRRTCSVCGKIYHLEFNPPQKENVCDECGSGLIQRPDDTPEGVHQRLKIYHEETEEVIKYYAEKGILIKINGEQGIEEVRGEIEEKMGM